MPEPRRLAAAAGLIVLLVLAAAVGYYLIGDGQWSFLDCLYMTLVTLSTVGYEEVLPVSTMPEAKAFTMILLVIGIAAVAFFLSTLTAFIVEGSLRELLGRRRMQRRIEQLSDHVIVLGVGRTGRHSATQFIRAGTPLAIVDRDEEQIQAFLSEQDADVPYVLGDGTRDATLISAGIERAKGLVCAMATDQDNLYAVLTARKLNPELRIASKTDDYAAADKFRHVGANSTVAPAELGGLRLYTELVRPEATGFLQTLLLNHGEGMVVQEVVISKGAELAGKTLAEADLRSRVGNVLVLSIQPPGASTFVTATPDIRVEPGATLIVMGDNHALNKLRSIA